MGSIEIEREYRGKIRNSVVRHYLLYFLQSYQLLSFVSQEPHLNPSTAVLDVRLQVEDAHFDDLIGCS